MVQIRLHKTDDKLSIHLAEFSVHRSHVTDDVRIMNDKESNGIQRSWIEFGCLVPPTGEDMAL